MTRYSGRRWLPPAASITSRRPDVVPRLREPCGPCWHSISGADEEEIKATNPAEMATDHPDRAAVGMVRSPLRVVIVEDEAIIAMELEMLLEKLDVEVVGIAMSAAEADALVAAHRPNFVTMDISIKGEVDGVSAALDIFDRYGVRSIFVSAYSDASTRARAEPANPFGWVRKPINKGDLEKAVRLVVRRDI